MTIKLQDFNQAILASGGKFAGLHRHRSSKGLLSDVALRVGQSYGSQLKAALEESLHDMTVIDEYGELQMDEYHIRLMANKCRASVAEFIEAYNEQRASWQASLDGTQPNRKRSTIPLAETLGKIEVAQINKEGTGINIRCVVRHTERERNGYAEHNERILAGEERKEPQSGKARVKAWMSNKYLKIRTYTLSDLGVMNKPEGKIGPIQRGPTFARFDMSGLSLKPEDISPMLSEWRRAQSA
jgi:hypothetical protein